MNQPTVTAYQETQPVQVQTIQLEIVPVAVGSSTLPHRESHKWLGIVQMFFGSLCLILGISGYCVGYDADRRPISYSINAIHVSGGGIYTGVFYIIAGLLGFLADRDNSRCLVVACMVMNIIATFVTVVGLGSLSVEVFFLHRDDYKYFVFQRTKCIIIIVCCVIEFITTIVHAAFSCASSCSCCLPRQAVTRPVQSLPRVTLDATPLDATSVSGAEGSRTPQSTSHRLAARHLPRVTLDATPLDTTSVSGAEASRAPQSSSHRLAARQLSQVTRDVTSLDAMSLDATSLDATSVPGSEGVSVPQISLHRLRVPKCLTEYCCSCIEEELAEA